MSVVVSKARADEITVAKFGGTSVADYQAMMRCAHIIKNDSCNRVVVVSASAGVTNNLVRLSQENVPASEQKDIISAIANIQFAITQHLTCQASLDLEITELLEALAICAEKQAANDRGRLREARCRVPRYDGWGAGKLGPQGLGMPR